MDLESERSAPEYVEDNEVVSQGTESHVNDDYNITSNESYSDEANDLGSNCNHDANVLPVYNESGVVQSKEMLAMQSPAVGSPPTKKGYGLKKWRRIKRDFVKDAGPSVDCSKILKRGLSASVNLSTTPTHLSSADLRQNSEASVGSGNVVKNIGIVDGFATLGSISNSRFVVGLAFAAGTASENSEDRSSKSSMAASAPKLRYELPAGSGYVRERNRMKNLSGKGGGNPTQRVQQVKSRAESSKKHRGEKDKIEKEDSHSSMESDSRSSNFVFMDGAFAVTSNRRQSGRSINYDGENSDDDHACKQQFGEEVQTGYTEENVGVAEDLSQDDFAVDVSWDAKEEKTEKVRPSIVGDPLFESLLALQSVQEALEKAWQCLNGSHAHSLEAFEKVIFTHCLKENRRNLSSLMEQCALAEVQKLGEMGKDAISLHNNLFKGSSVPADSTFTVPEIHGPSASSSLEMQVLCLTQNVQHLETKLHEMNTMLEVKELRVSELEAMLNSGKPLKEESRSTIELLPQQCRAMETELEGLFQQKIEAEVVYLALTRTIEKLRAASGGRVTLIEEQENLAEEQEEMLNKLGDAEIKAVVPKKQADELETLCGDILGTQVVLKMQNRACKVSSCFAIQFILLVLVWLFVLQLSPPSGVIVIVPT